MILFYIKNNTVRAILNFQDRISSTPPIGPTSPLSCLTSPYFLQREKSLLPKILGQLEPWLPWVTKNLHLLILLTASTNFDIRLQ